MIPDYNTQLQELSVLSMKELQNLRQLTMRYFGQNSREVRIIAQEIKRRKAIRPRLRSAVDALRDIGKTLEWSIRKLDAKRFKPKEIYDETSLDVFEMGKHEPRNAITGKLAYRLAIERISELEKQIKYIEEHIHIIQNAARTNAVTMDVLEIFDGIEPLTHKYYMLQKLSLLKKKLLPGTLTVLPTHYRTRVPYAEDTGPKIGDFIACGRSKNFKAGTYKIVAGGCGYNRYYCRKLMETLEPDYGFRLFVTMYAGGYGHYIISVPVDSCFEKALGYEFTGKPKGKGYYEKRKATYRFLERRTYKRGQP